MLRRMLYWLLALALAAPARAEPSIFEQQAALGTSLLDLVSLVMAPGADTESPRAPGLKEIGIWKGSRASGDLTVRVYSIMNDPGRNRLIWTGPDGRPRSADLEYRDSVPLALAIDRLCVVFDPVARTFLLSMADLSFEDPKKPSLRAWRFDPASSKLEPIAVGTPPWKPSLVSRLLGCWPISCESYRKLDVYSSKGRIFALAQGSTLSFRSQAVFELVDGRWRRLGSLPSSGLGLSSDGCKLSASPSETYDLCRQWK